MALLRALSRCLLSLMVAVAAVAPARAASTPEIEVVGAQTVTPEAVRSLMSFSGGETSDGRSEDAALKALMTTGLFADVTIERRGGKLIVTLVENPIIAAVSLEGASAIEKKKLEEVMTLKVRERYTQARAHADANRLRDLYRRQGRMATTVTPKATKRPDGRIDLAFVIAEGAVSKIDRIAFTGNRAFSERQLKDVITTSESSWLDILKTAAFYDAERIEADRELIRRHYVNHGHPEARVGEAKAELNAQGTAYTVTFPIEEGEERRFGRTSVESGVTGADTPAVQSTVKLASDKPYSREQIDKSVDAMSEALAAAGHPFARVTAKERVTADGQRVDVTFRIEPGKPLYVERIDIVGNANTKDFVIRRAIRLAEGDAVNAVLVEAARKRVLKLGFFKSVEVKHERGSAPDRVKLVFALVEQETGEFGIGGGYSMNEGIIGDISYTERNFLGNGQYLRLKLAGSAMRLQADAAFTEPHLLGSNVAGGFDLFYKDVDYTQQASYKSTKVGGDMRLGFPVTEQLTTTVNYTFTRTTLYDVGPTASAAIREAAAMGATYNTSSIGTTTAYDTRDSKKRPTSGVSYVLTQDFAGVGGDVRFLRTVGDVRYYYPVSDSVTFMGRATGGVISGWGGQDVRLLDLFTRGYETVRGFQAAGFGPRDTLSANQDALGGRYYYAVTAETLFDLPGVPKDIGLRGAVFADAGSLWGVNRTAAALPGVAGTTPALRSSVGVGLAWDSPIGPLRADYAIPLVKQAYDKTQPFSFGLSPF